MVDELQDAAESAEPLLERLRITRLSLDTNPWSFGDWNHCTCGHIYRAVVGGDDFEERHVTDTVDERFVEMLEVVIEANQLPRMNASIEPGSEGYASDLRLSVSDGTPHVLMRDHAQLGLSWDEAGDGERYEENRRLAACLMLDRAIEFEERRNHDAMTRLRDLERTSDRA